MYARKLCKFIFSLQENFIFFILFMQVKAKKLFVILSLWLIAMSTLVEFAQARSYSRGYSSSRSSTSRSYSSPSRATTTSRVRPSTTTRERVIERNTDNGSSNLIMGWILGYMLGSSNSSSPSYGWQINTWTTVSWETNIVWQQETRIIFWLLIFLFLSALIWLWYLIWKQ